MGYFIGLPSGWVYVYFTDGTELGVENTDTFSDAEAQQIANEWTNSKHGKEHGEVVRVDFRDSKDKLLKFWLIGKDGKMKREPLF